MTQHITKALYDPNTSTVSYLVYDSATLDAVIIDPVLDYEQASSTISQVSVQLILDQIQKNKLRVHYVLETHAHADHISGSWYIKQKLGNVTIAVHEGISKVQKVFANMLNMQSSFVNDKSYFDMFLKDGQRLEAGNLVIDVLYTPGHTPACCSYLVNKKSIFIGDTLFMPDYGTARCDFPGGDSSTLYDSVIQKLFTLADDTEVFVGHDYQPRGRKPEWRTTIGEQKKNNIMLNSNISKADFVRARNKRDNSLPTPKLLFPSIQSNIKAGQLPATENNGTGYFKIPLRFKNI